MGLDQWSTTAADNDDAADDINWAEGQAPGTVNDSARQLMADVAEFRDNLACANTTTSGGSDIYDLTTGMGISTLVDGLIVGFIAHTNNVGASQLNVDGTGNKPLVRGNDSDLIIVNLIVNAPYLAIYDASKNSGSGAWVLLNPSSWTAEAITSGTLPDARLSSNVAQYDATTPEFDNLLRSGSGFRVGSTATPAASNTNGVNIVGTGISQIQGGAVPALVIGRSNTGQVQRFLAAGGIEGSVTVTSGGGGTTYNTSSDRRLKKNIKDLTGALERILAAKPREFDLRANDRAMRGFIADEFQKVYPDSVSGKPGGKEMQSMQASTSEVMADVVFMIQSLHARISALENAE